MLGSRLSTFEKELWHQETAMFGAMGLGPREARREAKRRVKAAIAESKKEGTYGIGPLGASMLRKYRTDPEMKREYEGMTKDGVTDNDILEWWDLPDVERRLMVIDDDHFRIATMLERIDAGFSPHEACRLVWRSFPMFGICTKPPTFGDDEASVLLPEELKLRVLRWQERMQSEGRFDELDAESKGFTTMNGYIRSLARQGRL